MGRSKITPPTWWKSYEHEHEVDRWSARGRSPYDPDDRGVAISPTLLAFDSWLKTAFKTVVVDGKDTWVDRIFNRSITITNNLGSSLLALELSRVADPDGELSR